MQYSTCKCGFWVGSSLLFSNYLPELCDDVLTCVFYTIVFYIVSNKLLVNFKVMLQILSFYNFKVNNYSYALFYKMCLRVPY